MGIIRKLLAWLLSPLTTILYNVFVLAPLHFFNLLESLFNFVAGSHIDTLLFETSIVNGHPQINFFQSHSPLKPMFMTMLAIGMVLLTTFSGLAFACSTLSSKKFQWLNKVKLTAASAAGVFLIPVAFLTILSLSQVLMQAISGRQVKMTQSEQVVYQDVTRKETHKLIEGQEPLVKLLRLNDQIDRTRDKTPDPDPEKKEFQLLRKGDPKNPAFTINQIYENIIQKEQKWGFDPESDLVALVKQNRSTLNELFTCFKQNEFKLRMADVSSVLDGIKPGVKNDKLAQKLKKSIDYLNNLNALVCKFKDEAQSIMVNCNEKLETSRDVALYNCQQAYKHLYGEAKEMDEKGNPKPPLSFEKVTNLQSFFTEEVRLVEANLHQPKSTLMVLRQRLSDVPENTMTVGFYHVITGRKDNKWQYGGYIVELPSNFLIGVCLLLAGILLMLINTINAIIRIFNLAMFFVISPIVVLTSPLHEGRAFKGWLKVVLSNLIGLFGVVIILQLFATLYTSFDKLTLNSYLGKSDNPIMSNMRNILLLLFALAGMFAAWRGGQQISSIFGFQAGIMNAIQGQQMMNTLRMATGGVGKVASFGSKAIGFKGGFRKNMTNRGRVRNGGSSQDKGGFNTGGNYQKPLLRQGLGSVWKDRFDNLSGKMGAPMSLISGGKWGTKQSKQKHQEWQSKVKSHKSKKAKHKLANFQEKYRFRATDTKVPMVEAQKNNKTWKTLNNQQATKMGARESKLLEKVKKIGVEKLPSQKPPFKDEVTRQRQIDHLTKKERQKERKAKLEQFKAQKRKKHADQKDKVAYMKTWLKNQNQTKNGLKQKQKRPKEMLNVFSGKELKQRISKVKDKKQNGK